MPAERTLVISDIHGCLESLQTLLDVCRYAPGQDRLLLLGDYVDRGPASMEVTAEVMRLVREEGAEALRGNHDQRFVDLVTGTCGDPVQLEKFFKHGGVQTLESYCRGLEGWHAADAAEAAARWPQAAEHIRRTYGEHLDFLGSLPLYAEDDRHIFVHAGLNPAYEVWQEQPWHEFLWVREAFIPHPVRTARTVVFGHTKTVDIHDSAAIWFGGDKIGIDGGCPFGYQLNALEILPDGSYGAYSAASSCRWELKVS